MLEVTTQSARALTAAEVFTNITLYYTTSSAKSEAEVWSGAKPQRIFLPLGI